MDEGAFLAVIDTPGLYERQFSFALPLDSLEGYLYPGTYSFAGATGTPLIASVIFLRSCRMLRQSQAKWR